MSKQPITSQDLRKLNVLNDPQLSPDGGTCAFVRQYITDEDEYTSHLFLQKIQDDTPEQWTFGEGTVSSPRFSPDGQWLTFVSKRGTQKTPQLYLLSLNGGEAKSVTHLENGAGQPIWSPDSSRILFTTSFEKGDLPSTSIDDKKEKQTEKSQPLIVERLKYKSDAAGFLDQKNKQLAIYHVDNETTEFITDEEFDHEPSSWSPDGEKVCYFSNKQGDDKLVSDIYLLDVHSKKDKQLTNGKGMFSHGTFSPDGKTVACLGHMKEFAGATHSKIWTIDLSTNETSCITEGWDMNVSDSCIGDIRSGQANPGPVWTEDSTSIFALASAWGNTELYQVHLNGEVQPMTNGQHHVFGFSIHEETKTAIIGVSSPTNPGELYALSLETKKSKQLTFMNEQLLKDVQLQEPEEILFKGKDGLEIQGWILKPVGFKEGESYPGILEIHGGPHAMYGNTFFHELQLFAANGYAVFYSNPRGSHGYGQSFVDACRGDYGGMDYEDILSFTDAVLDHCPWIDEKRLGVTGGSYGGFMTNWIIGHTNRFKAAATLRCISNWISFYGVSDIGYFFTEWEVGTDLLKDPDKLWNHSPLKYVNKMETPLLIMHGEKDYRCPVEQAEQLYVALHQRGQEPRFVRFPDSNHELSRSGAPHLRQARLKELTDWFEKHLQN
ncbi:peptidase [Salipaludibacillus keqinensis]|uniref:Peptidase n=1 Tax=Salipaludibacillus keqinensis TaxID=2045207 RepID=A0A323TGC0_9BACI|nr:S9 family peptidase [Salipaludibacillus keqinensis]PYZ94182.1 peptidase [Salipaludibacillus keqinensis]